MDNSSLTIQRTLLEYFNKYNYTELFKQAFCEFLQGNDDNENLVKRTFYYPVSINLTFLNEINEIVGNMFISNPLIIQDLCKKLILYLIETFMGFKTFNADQIVVRIVIVNNDVSPLGSDIFHLRSLRGILAKFTHKPQNYVRTSNWICPNNCIPVSLIEGLPKSNPVCSICMIPLEEVSTFRNMGQFVKGQLIHNSRMIGPSQMVSWTDFCMEDARIYKLQLGTEYTLTGLWTNCNYFEVWGCHPVETVPWPLPYHSKIELIRTNMQNIPGAFIRILSYSLNESNTPLQNFLHLKMGLLLSLASTKSANPVPVLAISENFSVATDVMLKALNLTDRQVRFRYPFNQFGINFDGNTGILRGGALTYAKGGICYVYTVKKYPQHILDYILNSVVNGSISIKDLQNELIPLECAIWTVNRKPKNAYKKHTLTEFFNVFGFAWIVGNEPGRESEMIDLILNGNKRSNYQIPEDELKQYIASVNSLKVTITEDVDKLIKEYVSIRNITGYKKYSNNTYRILKSLVEAHARLNKRLQANEEDALVILQMSEFCLENLFTNTNISLAPKDLFDFKTWLKTDLFNSCV